MKQACRAVWQWREGDLRSERLARSGDRPQQTGQPQQRTIKSSVSNVELAKAGIPAPASGPANTDSAPISQSSFADILRFYRGSYNANHSSFAVIRLPTSTWKEWAVLASNQRPRRCQGNEKAPNPPKKTVMHFPDCPYIRSSGKYSVHRTVHLKSFRLTASQTHVGWARADGR